MIPHISRTAVYESHLTVSERFCCWAWQMWHKTLRWVKRKRHLNAFPEKEAEDPPNVEFLLINIPERHTAAKQALQTKNKREVGT